MEPRIGLEPITDNPMSSAHQSSGARPQNKSGQESDCGIAGVLRVAPPSRRRIGFAPISPVCREPTIYGPLKLEAQFSIGRQCDRLKAALQEQEHFSVRNASIPGAIIGAY